MSQDQDAEPIEAPVDDLATTDPDHTHDLEGEDEDGDEVEGFMFIDLKPPTLGGPPKGPSLPPTGPAGPGPSGPDTVRTPGPGRPPDPFFPT